MIEFKTIQSSNVIIRLDLNVPISNGQITNDFRIRESIPTISELLLKQNNVIILAHLGDSGESLQLIAEKLSTTFIKLQFILKFMR
jgi:phosphoglycerate kinase